MEERFIKAKKSHMGVSVPEPAVVSRLEKKSRGVKRLMKDNQTQKGLPAVV